MRKSNISTAEVRITEGVVPISKGGTGAVIDQTAAVNLGGFPLVQLDMAQKPAKLLGDRNVNPLQLPDYVITGVTIDGPTEVFPLSTSTFQITNYDAVKAYSYSVSAGSLVRTKDILTYRAPSTPQKVTMTVNGRVLPLTIREPWPYKPTLAATTTGTNISAAGIFTSSAFAMIVGNATHRRTDWEVAEDSDFTLPVAGFSDTKTLTTWSLYNLSLSRTFYVRARYMASNGVYSEWSDPVAFTTKSKYTPNAEEAKIVASDKVANDAFGWAVAIDSTGTRIVVGAFQADGFLAADVGAVYVFVRSGTSWTQEAKIMETAILRANYYLGFSVAISADGTRVMTGAYGATTSRGLVYIYSRSGTTWSSETSLSASDAANNYQFGYSVCCNDAGTYLAVGSPARKTGTANGAGAVYIFTRSGTTWSQQAIVNATDYAANDGFGFDLALDADATRLIVGAYLADIGGATDAGSAYVFRRNATVWTQEAKLVSPDRQASDQFGYCVAINSNGTCAVVGANLSDSIGYKDSGGVFVFERADTVWNFTFRLMAFDKAAGDRFGSSIDINAEGNRVVIGALLADPSGIADAGAVYIFSKVNAVWVQDTKIVASDKAASDEFGTSVAISPDGSRVVVGAYLEDPGDTSNAGSAYVYT